MIRNCTDCSIYLFDYLNTVTIDDCKNCKFFFGPNKGSLFIRDTSECVVVAACGQFRTRDCRKIVAFLSCASQPIIEATVSIKYVYNYTVQNDLKLGKSVILGHNVLFASKAKINVF